MPPPSVFIRYYKFGLSSVTAPNSAFSHHHTPKRHSYLGEGTVYLIHNTFIMTFVLLFFVFYFWCLSKLNKKCLHKLKMCTQVYFGSQELGQSLWRVKDLTHNYLFVLYADTPNSVYKYMDFEIKVTGELQPATKCIITGHFCTVWAKLSISVMTCRRWRQGLTAKQHSSRLTHFYSPHRSSLGDTLCNTFHRRRSHHWPSTSHCGRFYSSQTDCSLVGKQIKTCEGFFFVPQQK